MHGSGYHVMNPFVQLPFVMEVFKQAKKEKPRMSVFMPEYSLAPSFQFPIQLWEADRAYRYLVEELEISPSKIVLAGDSAGGHMVVSLLLNLIEPYPHLKGPDGQDLPLNPLGMPSKAILISPWMRNWGLDVPTDPHHSYQRNHGHDVLNRGLVAQWGHSFNPNASLREDPYVSPVFASKEWLKQLPPTLILASEYELIYDDILEFYQRCQEVQNHTEMIAVKDSIHDWPLVDWMFFPFDYKRRNRGVKAILNYLLK
jgi:acetyl esterase/lipase